MSNLNIKIITVDSARKPDFLAEHGLSLLIEYNGKKILFDSGQGLAIQHNLKTLNINTDFIDIFVLSHGHYDHSDGFVHILDSMKYKPFYLHEKCFTKRISSNSNRYTGISQKLNKENLIKKDILLKFTQNFTKIYDKIYLTGEIPRKYEKNSGHIMSDNRVDIMIDDMAMAIEYKNKIVIILGCTHSGIKNTIEYIRNNLKKPIYAIIGGTHLLHKNEDELIEISQYIDELDPEYCYFGHCTGIDSYSILKKYMKTDINHLYAGDIIDL
ncbi:MAG: MBL fold metallo-hydrolase [Candidatus Muirbacterium halophilum]|nr:MBL fold metallo-hydrolase [Candidatus Muirbacterium halophilum]